MIKDSDEKDIKTVEKNTPPKVTDKNIKTKKVDINSNISSEDIKTAEISQNDGTEKVDTNIKTVEKTVTPKIADRTIRTNQGLRESDTEKVDTNINFSEENIKTTENSQSDSQKEKTADSLDISESDIEQVSDFAEEMQDDEPKIFENNNFSFQNSNFQNNQNHNHFDEIINVNSDFSNSSVETVENSQEDTDIKTVDRTNPIKTTDRNIKTNQGLQESDTEKVDTNSNQENNQNVQDNQEEESEELQNDEPKVFENDNFSFQNSNSQSQDNSQENNQEDNANEIVGENNLEETENVEEIENPKKPSLIKRAGKKLAVGTIKVVGKTAFNVTKKIADTPFNKKIDKNETADHGAESLRLAKSTIKTTKKTIKTTAKTAKNTGKAVYNTTKFTVKAVAFTVKTAGKVAVNVVAVATNPIFWIIVAIAFVVVYITMSVVILLGGGAASASANQQAQTKAVGLGDVVTQYNNAKGFIDVAYDDRQNEFFDMINNIYYDYDNLTESDLVYLERFYSNNLNHTYTTGFASDDWKETLRGAWDFEVYYQETIAIAYVYLEKQKNDQKGTTRAIYQVEFSQDVFTEIMKKYANWQNTTYQNQECPNKNCTTIENPEWTQANENLENARIDCDNHPARHGCNPDTREECEEWQELYRNWENLKNIRDSIPTTIQVCEHKHKLNSIGLYFYSAEDVMNALGLDSNYKKWVELTIKGFETNPDLNG